MRNKKDLVSGLRVLEMRSGVLARCPLRGDGYYQFNWKTPTSYASSCKTVRLGLGDGAVHTAEFAFRR